MARSTAPNGVGGGAFGGSIIATLPRVAAISARRRGRMQVMSERLTMFMALNESCTENGW